MRYTCTNQPTSRGYDQDSIFLCIEQFAHKDQQLNQSEEIILQKPQNNFPPQELTEHIPANTLIQIQPKRAQKKKKRSDQHSLAQNIASKTITEICRLLQKQNKRVAKGKIKKKYKDYLKVNKVENSQLVFLFAYFFIKQQTQQKEVYLGFQNLFSKYLKAKQKETDGKCEKQRQALKAKVEANIDILNYLFISLGGEGVIDWGHLRELGKPLFNGKQSRRINYALEVGRQIELSIYEQNSQRTSKVLELSKSKL